MYHLVDNFATRAGDALVGYYVKLKDSEGNYATLYSDTSLTPIATVSGVANAAVTDDRGMYDLYVDDGIYDIEFFDKNNINTLVTRVPSIPLLATTFLQAGDDAVSRTMQDKLREFGVSVKDFGALADGSDDTAAIQAAIDTGAKRVFFPAGSYYAQGLTTATDQQQLVGLGDCNIFRNDDGALLTSAAADLTIENIAFWGQFAAEEYAGDLVVLTGARARLIRCAARDAEVGTDLVLKVTGSRSKIEGDKDGYYGDVQIGASGAVCLYPHLQSVYISNTLTMIETGHGKVEGGIIDELITLPGAGNAGAHGPKISGVRVGTLTIEHTSTTVCGGTTAYDDVTVGNGTDTVSGVVFDATFEQSGSKTFTISANVIESSFNLQGVPSGNTVTISSPVNAIWDRPRNYTPALTASGGSPAIGDGTLSGTIHRNGFERRATIQLAVGSTTNMGTGSTRISVPDAAGSSNVGQGVARIFDSGVGHKPALAEISPGTAYMVFYSSTTGGAFGGQTVDGTFPITFANGDAITANLVYSVL